MTLEIKNITPSGDVDGVNKIFTCPLAFIRRSTAVYIDIGRVLLDTDYTEISGTQIEFATAPNIGEVVTMDISYNDGVDTATSVGAPPKAAALCNPSMCRGLTTMLTDANEPSDSQIKNVIRSIDSKIGLMLAHRYENPPAPISHIYGVITTQVGDKVVSGIGTNFTSLQPGQTIQVTSTGEALRILSITSDTSLVLESEPISTAPNSKFWVIPEELVTASMWLSTQAVIMLYFPEKTLKQDNIEKFDKRMELFAGPIITILASGKYFNSDLRPQIPNKNLGRFLKVFENGIKKSNDDFISKVIDFK